MTTITLITTLIIGFIIGALTILALIIWGFTKYAEETGQIRTKPPEELQGTERSIINKLEEKRD